MMQNAPGAPTFGAPNVAPTAPNALAASTNRYEYLLQQVVQLNTDLHKTVALSQALQSERDSLQASSQQVCM